MARGKRRLNFVKQGQQHTVFQSFPDFIKETKGKELGKIAEELSSDFQTAEFVEKHGFVDKVVNRKDLTNEIAKLLEILLKKNSEVNSELLNETSTNIEQPTKAAS